MNADPLTNHRRIEALEKHLEKELRTLWTALFFVVAAGIGILCSMQ